MIIREGTVEVLVNGEWEKVGPGSVIFNASNQLHALKNVGTTPATYHVINWNSPGMKKIIVGASLRGRPSSRLRRPIAAHVVAMRMPSTQKKTQ